jgi:hypothetical protein
MMLAFAEVKQVRVVFDYLGLEVSGAKRLRALEDEYAKLK